MIAGVPVVVADTAGLRAAGDEIEREGVRRATKRAAEADMKLFVLRRKRRPILTDQSYGFIRKICLKSSQTRKMWRFIISLIWAPLTP